MNNITSKSRFVRLFGLAALLVLLMAVVSPVGATTFETWGIGSDTTLIEDHYGNIVITSDNITLDCAGHSVTGPGSGTGILLGNRTGVTVIECLVTNFKYGFELTNSSYNVLRSNQADWNTDDGFVLQYSNGNTFDLNTANGNGGGFWLRWSYGNTFIANTASDNNIWPGFALNDSSENEFFENTAKNNLSRGFHLTRSPDNILKSNVANGNSISGYLLADSDRNQLTENAANRNGYYGFGMAFGSAYNNLVSNVANNNDQYGIALRNASWNTLTGNLAMHNGSTGLRVTEYSENNLLWLNRGCNNQFIDAEDLSTSTTGNIWLDNNFCTYAGF